jgi:hypothetical protein
MAELLQVLPRKTTELQIVQTFQKSLVPHDEADSRLQSECGIDAAKSIQGLIFPMDREKTWNSQGSDWQFQPTCFHETAINDDRPFCNDSDPGRQDAYPTLKRAR